MATIVELLNQGLGGLNTPLGAFGTQLMQASGPQAGNPSGAVRLGQALAGMQQQQAQQQLNAYRQAMAQNALTLSQSRVEESQRKDQLAQREQQAAQSPELLQQLGPISRQLAQLGMPLGDILKAQNGDATQQHRAAMLQQQQAQMQQSASQFAQQQARLSAGGGGVGQPPGPKQPANRQIYEEPLENNLIQKHIFDPATNSYKRLGAPYQRFAPTKADPLQDLLNEVTPDDNVGAGQAVPGLPGSNASATPPPHGVELLMHGSGSNPMARKPAASEAAAPSGDLAAAKGAIAAGKSRQAVIARLTQSGYTPAQIQAAGI
jgi:hypothetical protein